MRLPNLANYVLHSTIHYHVRKKERKSSMSRPASADLERDLWLVVVMMSEEDEWLGWNDVTVKKANRKCSKRNARTKEEELYDHAQELSTDWSEQQQQVEDLYHGVNGCSGLDWI